ncbi:DUF3653 domain-containing protein [Alcanivorax sp. 24]|uniref:DUF3653 domain-containing protein n=1 Tax=Alcanivorax sp. 24 TaxID=2545266 RepID=UPI00105C0BBD|nr:DUF3653 domain-containing protein [Alcanivorax sp. 24]
MEDFTELAFGLAPRQIADIVGCSLSTARRYHHSRTAPDHVLRLLAIHRNGHLPTTCPTWRGWRVQGSHLIDPMGLEYAADDVTGLWVYRQLADEYRRILSHPIQYALEL